MKAHIYAHYTDHLKASLSTLPYEEQVSKKSKEARWVAQQLANEITTANPATKNWVEFQTQKYVFIARVQDLKESPVLTSVNLRFGRIQKQGG